MKKIVVLIIILIIFVTVCISFKVINKKNEYIEIEETYVDWQAKYIWIESNEETIRENEWVCFRKNFNINSEKDIKNAVCRIAVESKYWLYINGEIVIRDGGLKRGEIGNSIYYDKIDIEKYLTIGENNISILVWHFGKSGFSHIDSGQGALLFQMQLGEDFIVSDNTWKVSRNEAYLNKSSNINTRLSESDIYYDSNLELEDWYKNEYNDTDWKTPIVLGGYKDDRWGTLIKRDIPFFVYSNIKEYENVKNNGTILEMKLPYNMQILPYLKIKANGNEQIIISNNKDFDNSVYYGKVTYVAKPGEQEYESPSWINGDKIYYQIPEGVEIILLGYRQTGYDTEMSGNFECDDNELNTLWKMANRTLYLNMRDTYMDCPDRERAMWIGDLSIEMEEAMYGLDTSANALYEKCIKTILGWRHEEVFCTVSPSIFNGLQLPIQNLLSISSMYNYYEYTGNLSFLEMIYEPVKDYMKMWNFGDNGLVAGSGNYYWNLWKWYDSQGVTDSYLLENMWYYYALDSQYKMAKALNKNYDVNIYKNKLDKMKEALNQIFWDEEGYKSKEFDRGYDVRVNSLAVLTGVADKSKYDKLFEVIIDNTDNSTFMEKYVLEALSKMGRTESAQKRIKDRYSEMIANEGEFSTLWEYWCSETGSTNHAWSGGPLIIMSKYFAGIQPLKPGYEEILLKPDFGTLKKINTKVNTVKGIISLNAEKSENTIFLEIYVPKKALIAVEKVSNNVLINNKEVYKNGKFIENELANFEKEDEKYVYLFLEEGKYTILSK